MGLSSFRRTRPRPPFRLFHEFGQAFDPVAHHHFFQRDFPVPEEFKAGLAQNGTDKGRVFLQLPGEPLIIVFRGMLDISHLETRGAAAVPVVNGSRLVFDGWALGFG